MEGDAFSTELSGAFGDVPFGTRSLKLQDYYAVLGLDRSASLCEIRNGYRLTAIKWHPDRAAEDMKAHALSQFQLAAEAFSVLDNPERRVVYDRYGHQGLLHGIQGTAIEGASTSVNAMEVYETFFGSVSPFADIIRERGDSAKKKANTEGPAVEHTLDISLEEAVRGTTKDISLEGNRIFTVTVTPGTVNGTVLSYEGMGFSDAQSSKPGPLLVTVRFGPQEGVTMCPEGSGDLHFTKSVGLWDAFLGITLDLPDLASGGRSRIVVDEAVSPSFVKRVLSKGAPRADGTGIGDLVIHFEVVFPMQINERQRELIDELKCIA